MLTFFNTQENWNKIPIFYFTQAKIELNTPNTGNCPNNSLAVDDKCFQFFPDGLETFYTAEVACLRANGELAIIESCQLLSDLASFIYENGQARLSFLFFGVF